MTMDEHAAIIEVVTKALQCPVFNQNGCPYDPKHPHTVDATAFKKCPAFKEGCPYKDVQLDAIKKCPAFKDHKCPFDGSHPLDLSKIDQCPAFKGGCPYAHFQHKHEAMNEHTATEHIAEQATHCPVFAHHCPFDPNHPHSLDLSKIKDCPAFKEGGCPFKQVRAPRLNDCPAFKGGKCPFNGAKSVDISKIKDCPAFKNGCPYSNMHKHEKHSNMNEHVATEHIATMATKCPFFSKAHCPFDPQNPHSFDLSKLKSCPAFEKGECPFKGVHHERLKECPAFKDGKCPFDGTKPVDLSRVKECPAFQKGCPYSHLHSSVSTTTTTTTTSAATTSSTITVHALSVRISTAAAQCPYFNEAHGGCPYDPNHLRSIDTSKVKDCPAFQKSGGCPYKHITVEGLSECPAFGNGKCPFDGKLAINLAKLKDCPAFKEGCPYRSITAPSQATTETTPLNPPQATPSNTTDAPTQQQQPQHPPGDPAKCPFASMHGKMENPHK